MKKSIPIPFNFRSCARFGLAFLMNQLVKILNVHQWSITLEKTEHRITIVRFVFVPGVTVSQYPVCRVISIYGESKTLRGKTVLRKIAKHPYFGEKYFRGLIIENEAVISAVRNQGVAHSQDLQSAV